MQCSECERAMDAYLDDALAGDERTTLREHVASCATCAHELEQRTLASARLRDALPRQRAPDVLRARIRGAVHEAAAREARMVRFGGVARLAAVAVFAAVAGSGLTLAFTGRTAPSAEPAVLASHIRSLMPGHLTDVVSTDQHNVKPWFNGRVDVAPAVPDLSAAGFPLVGGRLDYVDGHVAAAVVYGRRRHVVTVYSWPAPGSGDMEPASGSDQGFNLVHWRRGGVECWAVSDIPGAELAQFARQYEAAGR